VIFVKNRQKTREPIPGLDPLEKSSSVHNNAGILFTNLRESHETVLNSIEEGYIEIDLKGNLVFCNDSFCKILGYSKEELWGLNYKQYMTHVMAESTFLTYNKVYRTGVHNREFYNEVIRRDGTRRMTDNSISLLRDSEGHRRGFRSVVRDITDRRKTEEELEKQRTRLQAIFGSVNDAIIMIDPKMVVVEANEAVENICGLMPQQIINRVFNNCFSQCKMNCLKIIQDDMKNKTTTREYKIACDYHSRPQQRVIITTSHLMSRDKEFLGLVIVIRDITRLSSLEQELSARYQFQSMIGKSPKIKEIYDFFNELADLDTTVLITGETGTGKSLAAKAIHNSGNRASKPLVTVNCSILSENLLESELFGHVRGAFTGAIKDTQGRFQVAKDGTILLDEIGDMSLKIQMKLLRILQEKEYERVGEPTALRVNARVIACTNQDLQEKVNRGEFRKDLYYRLKVVEVIIPPLRERIDDIPLFIEHFCNIFNKRFSKKIRGVSNEVMEMFMDYHWLGNIRELEHCMEHAYVLCRDPIISHDHIPKEIREHSGLGRRLREKMPSDKTEGDILAVLEKTYWNMTKAARILRMDRSTLYRKISKYGLTKPDINA
jgi:two-component system, NtrC family, response regulator HydG